MKAPHIPTPITRVLAPTQRRPPISRSLHVRSVARLARRGALGNLKTLLLSLLTDERNCWTSAYLFVRFLLTLLDGVLFK